MPWEIILISSTNLYIFNHLIPLITTPLQHHMVLWSAILSDSFPLIPDPRANSVGEAESWVVITEVTLLVFRQLIPVVSSAFIAQSILPSDIEEKYDGAEDT